MALLPSLPEPDAALREQGLDATMWVCRRFGYDERSNPNHMVLTMAGDGGIIGGPVSTAALEPTALELLQLVAVSETVCPAQLTTQRPAQLTKPPRPIMSPRPTRSWWARAHAPCTRTAPRRCGRWGQRCEGSGSRRATTRRRARRRQPQPRATTASHAPSRPPATLCDVMSRRCAHSIHIYNIYTHV
jgi:hypothetical protein